MYNVTMRITFVKRKFGNVERNSHCDVLHITPIRVARLFLDCNGDFAIKAYSVRVGWHQLCRYRYSYVIIVALICKLIIIMLLDRNINLNNLT